MSNNFQVTPGSGIIIATELGAGSESYQKIKLIDPTVGATSGIGNSANPMKVDPTGTTTQPVSGTVAISNLPGTQPVSGTVAVSNFPATQPVSGTFFQATQPVSGTIAVSNFPATQPVSGTFFQATQPISGTVAVSNFPATQPVSGTFFQATQPVSGTVAVSNFPATQPVSGTFFQATQPVSIAATINTTEDYSIGKSPVLKTGTLVTTATTADQVILTYTVTAGKTFYLLYYAFDVQLTAVSATASVMGTISLETPSGTKVFTTREINPTTSESSLSIIPLPVPVPIAAGTVIRIVCTPAAVTSMTWLGNFGGYEK